MINAKTIETIHHMHLKTRLTNRLLAGRMSVLAPHLFCRALVRGCLQQTPCRLFVCQETTLRCTPIALIMQACIVALDPIALHCSASCRVQHSRVASQVQIDHLPCSLQRFTHPSTITSLRLMGSVTDPSYFACVSKVRRIRMGPSVNCWQTSEVIPGSDAGPRRSAACNYSRILSSHSLAFASVCADSA